MSSKKTREIAAEAEKSLKEFEEKSQLLAEANEEDAKFLETKKASIEESLAKDDIFCGIILDTATITEIIKLHLETKEPIKIPFNLYFN